MAADSSLPDNPSARTVQEGGPVRLADLAQAAVLLESGRLDEHQLSLAVRYWSASGDFSLAEQLARQGMLTVEEGRDLATQAEAYLRRTGGNSGAPDDPGATAGWTDNGPDYFQRLSRLLSSGSAPPPTENEEGRQVNTRFTLVRKLGQGGLGRVWLARDENLRRKVALKELIVRSPRSEAVLRRFQREAEITGQLEHPNIVSIYQYGEDIASGRAFYAMRFVGKKTLQDAIQEYHEKREYGMDVRMELHRLLSAFLTVCQAIGYAHSCGVIHRDLKPENIALDSFGQVIVLDWGLAKALEDGDHPDLAGLEESGADRTVAGQVLGTPLYMAPEQAAGKLDEIDERTDIFGLGAILFAILTGYAPHERSHSSLSTSSKVSELYAAIANTPTPRVLDHFPGADPALASICDKAMAKRRYARYDNAGLLAEDVQRWMAGESVSSYREPFGLRVGHWIGQHRRLSQVLAVAAITLLMTGITLAVMAHQQHLAERTHHFRDMAGQARQLAAQLESAAQGHARQTRFMADVPPIKGIQQSRGGQPDAEDEDVWRNRLEQIYLGLLRNDADNLAATFLSVDAMGKGKGIVRVIRHAVELDRVVVVPKSRLAEYEAEGFVQSVSQLQPGEVRLECVPRKPGGSGQRRSLALRSGTPVYDDAAGGLFGAVVIEADLGERCRRLLAGLKGGAFDVFVTDGAGKVLLSRRGEGRLENDGGGADIAAHVPGLEGFFAEAEARFRSDQRTFVALRVPLDPTHPAGVVGIVFRAAEN